MDSLKKLFNEKVSDPITGRAEAGLLGGLYGMGAVPLYNLARGRAITPSMILAGGALGAALGVGVNEFNRRYFSAEFDEWRTQKNIGTPTGVHGTELH